MFYLTISINESYKINEKEYACMKECSTRRQRRKDGCAVAFPRIPMHSMHISFFFFLLFSL